MMTDLQDDDDDAAVAEDHFDPTSEMGRLPSSVG
jgi:hypothetical protein